MVPQKHVQRQKVAMAGCQLDRSVAVGIRKVRLRVSCAAQSSHIRHGRSVEAGERARRHRCWPHSTACPQSRTPVSRAGASLQYRVARIAAETAVCLAGQQRAGRGALTRMRSCAFMRHKSSRVLGSDVGPAGQENAGRENLTVRLCKIGMLPVRWQRTSAAACYRRSGYARCPGRKAQSYSRWRRSRG